MLLPASSRVTLNDLGVRRAGVPPTSEQMRDIIAAAIDSSAVEIYGFYSRKSVRKRWSKPDGMRSDFGQSYASDSLDRAAEYYGEEISCVNTAAKVAREMGVESPFVLSVGATPTAHAATQQSPAEHPNLEGELEL